MWTFVASDPTTKHAYFGQRFITLKSVHEATVDFEKKSRMLANGCIYLSSVKDKSEVPVVCEKYLVDNELYIPFRSSNDLFELYSKLTALGFSESKISKVALYKIGWFTK